MAVEIKNKKASYQYFLEDTFTAGIQLQGVEVKSIRNGKASIGEAYCRLQGDELFVFNMYIAEYENRGYEESEPRRPRKLLLNRTEINKIVKKLKNVGYTIVPTKMYVTDAGWVKLDIALAKGKKQRDKREDLKQKDIKRDMERE
jgi:SsrA-binding protein